jgi:hypothetical protein
VHEDFWFIRPNGDAIHVPANWDSDLASTKVLRYIPILWVMFPSSGQWNQACVLHDYICGAELFPIKICNEIFREALEAELAVPRWKIAPMKAGVDIGCWATYKKHTEESVSMLRKLTKVKNTGKRPLWADGVAHFPIG